MGNIINDHKSQGEWKIRLKITINSKSSKDSTETHTMHSKQSILGHLIGNETDKTIE